MAGRKSFVSCGERSDVEIDLTLDIVAGHLGKLTVCAKSGVVDEDVDGDVFALELVEEEFRSVRVGKVKRDGFHRHSVRLKFRRDVREFFGAARDENEIVTIAGEEFGEFVSDAAGCACDEDGGHAGILNGSCSPGRIRPGGVGHESQNPHPFGFAQGRLCREKRGARLARGADECVRPTRAS